MDGNETRVERLAGIRSRQKVASVRSFSPCLGLYYLCIINNSQVFSHCSHQYSFEPLNFTIEGISILFLMFFFFKNRVDRCPSMPHSFLGFNENPINIYIE